MDEMAISIKNVSLIYKMSTHKVDSLKEYFIEGIKGRLEYKKFYALNDISIDIRKGEKIGIIGHNGAGKSTLLKIICGVMKPSEGDIDVSGTIAPMLELGAGFDQEFTGAENIFLNGAILGKTKEFLESKFDAIVDFADIGEFMYVPVKNYSSGMRAKLGFSIATQTNPDILIIDEVLGVGDAQFRKKSSDKILELINSGKTVIIVSHNVDQLKVLTDRIIWLDEGKIIATGSSDVIIDRYSEYMKNRRRNNRKKKQNV